MEVKTILNLGDSLWIMYNNRPQEIKIERIRINVVYKFDGFTNKVERIYYCACSDVSIEESTIGKEAFLTKEDLINSLL